MTPKEKARELVSKFEYQNNYGISEDTGLKGIDEQLAKQCALISVDEILLTLNKDIRDLDVRGSILIDLIEYWRKVKREIEKL